MCGGWGLECSARAQKRASLLPLVALQRRSCRGLTRQYGAHARCASSGTASMLTGRTSVRSETSDTNASASAMMTALDKDVLDDAIRIEGQPKDRQVMLEAFTKVYGS